MDALVCSLVVAVTAGGAKAIPDVRSLDELRTLDAAAVIDHWDVRLGLADPGDDAGPWWLLVCHTKFIGTEDDRRRATRTSMRHVRSHTLGPVSVTVEPGNAKIHRATETVMHLSVAGGGKDDQRLYAAAIPAVAKGEWWLTVWGPDLHMIQRRKVVVKADRACAWRVLARRDESVPRDREPTKYRVENTLQPALPRYAPRVPIWCLQADQQFEALRAQPGKTGFLPGRLPPWPQYEPRYYDGRLREVKAGRYPYPLDLSLDGNDLVIRSQAPMIDQPDELLLARWWVAGKLLATRPQKAALPAREVARRVRHSRETRIGLVLPPDLGQRKPGTKVSVQVMYCPDGYDPFILRLSRLQRALVGGWPAWQPMLSGKLTFAVTKRMLGP